MTDTARPGGVDAPAQLPQPPFDVVVFGAGRVGGSLAKALTDDGHRVHATLGRHDDPSPVARATLVVLAVPDDELQEAAGVVARMGRPGAAVVHTCGMAGLEPLIDCGRLIAAIHPAIPVATPHASFEGVPFGITCARGLETWCDELVRGIGGIPFHVPSEQRVAYHAALAIASNFAVTLAADAAELAGSSELLVPLLRATVENIARLGPRAALTGPIARGDAGTVRAHLAALPPSLLEAYVANAKRTLAHADMTREQRSAIEAALEEALVR